MTTASEEIPEPQVAVHWREEEYYCGVDDYAGKAGEGDESEPSDESEC